MTRRDPTPIPIFVWMAAAVLFLLFAVWYADERDACDARCANAGGGAMLRSAFGYECVCRGGVR